MLIIRPIRSSDLDDLMALIDISGFGLSSLPRDREIMKKKIQFSENCFQNPSDIPNGEVYYFALEDLFTGKMVGISGLITKLGGFEPFYFYRLDQEQYQSKMLGVSKTIRSLHIEKTHAGPAELCSLFLHPDYRSAQNGRFLSLVRFLFMAEKPHLFEETIIAEMRGQVDDQGRSPFWDAVGHKLMDIDFLQADYLSLKSKKFIEDLHPKYPLVIDLLPQAAQEVVAEVHPQTVPAKKILVSEGFSFSGLVGIFEPGPIMEARVENIRTFKESRYAIISEISVSDFSSGELYIIATSLKNENLKSPGKERRFMATVSTLEFENDKVKIAAMVATSLKLKVGDGIRYAKLK